MPYLRYDIAAGGLQIRWRWNTLLFLFSWRVSESVGRCAGYSSSTSSSSTSPTPIATSSIYSCSFGSFAFLFTFVTLLDDFAFCTLSNLNLYAWWWCRCYCCSLICFFIAVSLIEWNDNRLRKENNSISLFYCMAKVISNERRHLHDGISSAGKTVAIAHTIIHKHHIGIHDATNASDFVFLLRK